MKWNETIREDTILKRWTEIIRKAPPPFYANKNRYNLHQFNDIPGFDVLFSQGNFPLYEELSRAPRTTVKSHAIMKKEGSEDVMGDEWRPSISNRQNAVMWVSIFNLKTKGVVYDWISGSLRNVNVQDQLTQNTSSAQLASGARTFPLEDDEIGISVIYDLKPRKRGQQVRLGKPSLMINIYHGSKSNFSDYVNITQTEGTGDQDYDLTNGEVAALIILSQIKPDGPPKQYLQQQDLFLKLGIGPLTQNTESKYIKTLTDRGFIDMNLDSRTNNMRGYPKITPRGMAASNRFEMHHRTFRNEFSDVVMAKPDEEFTMFYEDKQGKTSSFNEDMA